MNKLCGGNGDTAKNKKINRKNKKEAGFFRILRGCRVHSLKMEAVHELLYIFKRNPSTPLSLSVFLNFLSFIICISFCQTSKHQKEPWRWKQSDVRAGGVLCALANVIPTYKLEFHSCLDTIKSSCQPVAVVGSADVSEFDLVSLKQEKT